jgi:hypothetical protein
MAGRCVVKGKTVETEELPAYCAVAIAGLGGLPDTILSRSIVIRMCRRAPNEQVEPYRRRVHAPQGYEIRDALVTWALAWCDLLALSRPNMPESIQDRDADVWEAPFAIADCAGGDWPLMARVAAVALVADAKRKPPSLGLKLLADIRTVFDRQESMPTEEIVKRLVAMDEAPWADLRGKAIDARRLARYLQPYDVSSKNIRSGTSIVKGYTREDLHDVWIRYLGEATNGSATSATLATDTCVRCDGEGCAWCSRGPV